MHDVTCPYCGDEVEINHDDAYGYEEDRVFHQECHCGKTFIYTTSISYNYDVEKAPCLNGEEHDWEDITGYPKGYQLNRKRCSCCGKTELKDPTLKYIGEKDTWVKKETDG